MPPTEQIYDTRPAVKLLLKKSPSNVFSRARRNTNPELFHQKNVVALKRGVTIQI
jgi:hypothetical protein